MNDQARELETLARELVQVAVKELDQALRGLDPTVDLNPTRDRVLAVLIPEEYVSDSGLILSVGEKAPWRAMVLGAGPKVENVARGDIIIVDGITGHQIPHRGADQAGIDLRLIQEADVLAVLQEAQ
jgi:co-chaperonin GroES (HSP10)